MFDIVGDLRQALRSARKTPGQTALIVATLALAIGMTTIGFAFVDTIMLRGLPIAEPDDTVIVFAIDQRQPDRRVGVFFDDYLDFRERVRGIEQLSAWSRSRSTLQHRGDAYVTEVSRVAGDLLGVWGVRVQLGRGLRPGDDAPGAPRVALLADHYWRQVFAGSPAVVGESILLDGVPHEIVGVLDRAIEFGNFASVGIWASLPLERGTTRDARSVMMTGRLAEDTGVEAAGAELAAIARALEGEFPNTNRGRTTLTLASNRAIGGPNFWIVVSLLIASVMFVMMIAAANVAAVLLARATARQREFGLRVALGARRSRVFRQLAIEGGFLAAMGAAGGLVTAEAGLRVIRSVEAEAIFQQLLLDWHEVGFVALLSVVTPLLFSFAPALAALRTNLPSLLNAGGPRSGRSGGRARHALVVAQLALAVTLVMVGGLVLRTATAMASAPTGFDQSSLLLFGLTFDDRNHPPPVRRAIVRAIEARLLENGAISVGALDSLPAVSIEMAAPIELDGLPVIDGQEPWAHVVGVDADALSTMAIPLLDGRALTRVDVESDANVALISAQTADRYFGSIAGALGRRLIIRSQGSVQQRQIVGVTGDVRNVEPERGIPPRVWIPLAAPPSVSFVIRTAADPAAFAPLIRQSVRDVATGVPIEGLETYDQAISRRAGSDRVIIGMLATFSAVALLFAATGLYGMVAYSVTQRRAEFGTRFALGAQVRDVVRLVVGQAFMLLAIGLALGVPGGLAVGHAMRNMLYRVTPFDALNVASVVALLTIVTLAASLMPAWRAARVDVVEALRAE